MPLAQTESGHLGDILAINHLAAFYADAVSRADLTEAVTVYVEDGVLESPTTEDAVGHPAIINVLTATTADLEFVFQTVHIGLVQVVGGRAHARFPITEWARRRSDGRPIQFRGVYEDHAVRTPDGWRISRRRLSARIMGRPEGLTGRVVPWALDSVKTW